MTVRLQAANRCDRRCKADGGTQALGGSAECNDPSYDENLRGRERTSVTDTDLIAAGSGAEEPDLPTAVTSEKAESKSAAEGPAAPGDGALATMVLPELRALANEVG